MNKDRPKIEINAVSIRQAEPEDFEAMYELLNDASVYANTLQMPYPSKERWRNRLASEAEGTYRLLAEYGGKVIGSASLHRKMRERVIHSAIIGISIHPDYQGCGVGSKLMDAVLDLADHWLNLRRLELTLFPDNEVAQRLYEKKGFAKEGQLRDFAFRDGKYVDVIMMGRIHIPPT